MNPEDKASKITLEAIQDDLAKKVSLFQIEDCPLPKGEELIFTLDIQYVEEDAYVGIDVLKANGEQLGVFVSKEATGMKYIPRYFAFREGPPLESAIRKLIRQHKFHPAVLMVDGHGIAHPRKLGVASWLGVQLDIPTIGLAKKTLLPYDGPLQNDIGSHCPVLLDQEQVGLVLRTQTAIQPVFVSVGHRYNLQQASALVLKLANEGYRIPAPMRRADQAARAFAKGELLENVVII